MAYNVKINGNSYVLPVKTMEVMRQIERFTAFSQLYEDRKVSIEEIVTEQYEFLVKCIGEEATESFLGTDLDSVNVDLLSFAVLDIVEAYTKDAIKKQLQSQTAQLKTLLADKDIARVVDAVSKTK